MRRDHHRFFRPCSEQRSPTQVGLRVRFVVVEELRGQDAVPRQPAVLGHLGKERHVAVGQCRDDEFLFQAFQSAHRIGPGPQTVPDAVEVIHVGFGQPCDPEAREDLLQDQPMQPVDVHPRQIAAADAVHGWPVSGAPRVSERCCVQLEPAFGGECLGFADDAAAPVDDRAEHVEQKHTRSIQRRAREKEDKVVNYTGSAVTRLTRGDRMRSGKSKAGWRSPRRMLSAVAAS